MVSCSHKNSPTNHILSRGDHHEKKQQQIGGIRLCSWEDEGEGFNWKEKINAPLELKGIAERGRGIAITRKYCKKLLYNKKGNKATLFVKL